MLRLYARTDLLSTPKAATCFGIPLRTFERWIEKGLITPLIDGGQGYGRQRRWSVADLKRQLGRKPVLAEDEPATPTHPSQAVTAHAQQTVTAPCQATPKHTGPVDVHGKPLSAALLARASDSYVRR